MNRKQYLFCPGPVHVAENVKIASQEDMCHREQEFSDLMKSLNQEILELFEIKNKDSYYPIIITGSSTSANESILSTIVDGKAILILSNGEFGDRLNNISKIHNPNTHVLEFGWANKIDPEKVEEYVKKHGIQIIAMTHHETSTGMINPVKKIGQIAKKYNALFFVDAVSSIGADLIDIEGSNVSFCTTSSGKALASFPGSSIVLGKVECFEALKNVKQRTMYLHLYKFYRFSRDLLQTPNTPNVSGFLALNQAIKNINKEGIRNRIDKIKNHAVVMRQALKKLGLEFLISEEDMSNALTTVKIPKGMTPVEIQKKLRDRKIIIYNGKGPFKDSAIQISNIGEIDSEDIQYLISNFEQILSKSKHFRYRGHVKTNRFAYVQ